MFVADLKQDFYGKLLGQRVLVLVHADVDATCACRVLQALFRCDNIAHTVVLVSSVEELVAAYAEHAELRTALLLNCGGTVDLVALLQPPDDAVLYVLDAHKPSDVCNVYSDGQVRLVQRDPEEDVPDFDDIFRDDEDDDDEHAAEEVGEGVEDAERTATAAALRRRDRRAWEQRRHTLMFNYTQFSFHGKPSACVALELAWRLARADAGAVWAAAVAGEAAAALCARSSTRALLDTAPLLHQHVARLQHAAGAAGTATPPASGALVCAERDAWLPLYRSWSVEAAVRHAPTLAPHLRLHTLRGETRVRQLLADMGFPLQQARQAYRAMDVALRRELPSSLEAACTKHGLPSPARATFLLRRPLAPPQPALDHVYILMALLEDEEPAGRLERALAALGVGGGGADEAAAATARGAEQARRKLECVARAVHAVLAHKQLHTTGPFNYFLLQEGTTEARALGRPLWLAEAARWAAACAGAGGSTRPLLACAPSADSADLCLVVGLPPKHADEPRNLLGAAFEQAGEECGCSVSRSLFHAATVLVPRARRTHFIDALTKLLA